MDSNEVFRDSLSVQARKQTQKCLDLNGISTDNVYLPSMDRSEKLARMQSMKTLEKMIEKENTREMHLAQCQNEEQRKKLEMQYAEERAQEEQKLVKMLPTLESSQIQRSSTMPTLCPKPTIVTAAAIDAV